VHHNHPSNIAQGLFTTVYPNKEIELQNHVQVVLIFLSFFFIPNIASSLRYVDESLSSCGSRIVLTGIGNDDIG